MAHYWQVILELVRTPFLHIETIWGVVPLYFGWILNELTSGRASFNTATQTGFGFLWAGAHWTWQYLSGGPGRPGTVTLSKLFAVNVTVTFLVIVVGLVALVSGLRRRFPKHCKFLGHSRFSAYFMIAIFPIQSNYLAWSWDRLIAILIFAVPLWFTLHMLLSVVRRD